MRRAVLLSLVLFMTIAGGAGLGAHPAQSQAPDGWVRVLITLPSRPGPADQGAIAALGGSVVQVLDSSPTISVFLPARAVEHLKKNSRFLSVREDPLVTALEDTLPWGIDRTGADSVWGSAQGAVNVVTGHPAGSGVLVAVIDTGIRASHSDLAANVVGGINYAQICTQTRTWWGGTTWSCRSGGSTEWTDDNGHGTHVAGTIGSLDNGSGFLGMAPKVSLYAIRALDTRGSGYLSDIVKGIDHAVSIGADVINMSLGTSVDDPALRTAVNNAAAAGVVVVAAAGNSGSGTDTVGYPAKYDSAIAVAATCGPVNSSYCSGIDTRASFSSTGPAVEIAAPGDNIPSTYYNGGYATMSGTSMAAPHIAGAAALVLSCNPDLTGAQVRSLLTSTAIDLGPAGRDSHFGYGLVSATAAVEAAGCGSDSPPPPPPPGDTTPPDTAITANPPSLTNSTSASFSFTSTEPNSTFECSLDSGAYSSCTSPRSYTGLSNGSHTFNVRAKDAAGNIDPTPASFTWTVDTVAPQTTITSAPTNGTATSVSFAFASDEPGSTFACSLDSTSNYLPCTSPYTVSGLVPGQHTFRVRATDAAGNTDSTPASHTWTVESAQSLTLRVADIDAAKSTGWWSWSVQVTVKVVDQNGQPVSGATVAAAWSGAANASVSGTTSSQGLVTFTRSSLSMWSSSGASITLTVSNVTKSGYTYTPAANSDPDGDSNGTSITVYR